MIKGRSKDKEAMELIHFGILCKVFSCKPSELREESYEDLMKLSLVYEEIAKKNPMFMFM